MKKDLLRRDRCVVAFDGVRLSCDNGGNSVRMRMVFFSFIGCDIMLIV